MIYAHILMFIIIQGNFPYLSKVIVYIKNFIFIWKVEKRENVLIGLLIAT